MIVNSFNITATGCTDVAFDNPVPGDSVTYNQTTGVVVLEVATPGNYSLIFECGECDLTGEVTVTEDSAVSCNYSIECSKGGYRHVLNTAQLDAIQWRFYFFEGITIDGIFYPISTPIALWPPPYDPNYPSTLEPLLEAEYNQLGLGTFDFNFDFNNTGSPTGSISLTFIPNCCTNYNVITLLITDINNNLPDITPSLTREFDPSKCVNFKVVTNCSDGITANGNPYDPNATDGSEFVCGDVLFETPNLNAQVTVIDHDEECAQGVTHTVTIT